MPDSEEILNLVLLRLKEAHDAGAQVNAPGDELADTAETARRDLDRIFDTGGVAALVGNTGATKGRWRVSPGAIRGLALLEPQERMAAPASLPRPVAAGLNGRIVRLAERQGEMMAQIVRAALADPELALPLDKQQVALTVIRRT